MRKSKILSLDEAYEEKLQKAMFPVKGHMAGGHFVKPYFKKPTWLVTFANGEKTKVAAISKWAALQEAKQYSALAPITVEEEKE